ncbi:MAG: GNAT family N-acetyltransferase [Proteobacteria bacterium]|nr:GNAT family N-acetyltransferase [Pseudomonadota bacterium]
MSALATARITLFSHADALAALARGLDASPFQSAGWVEGWMAAHGTLANLRVVEVAVEGGSWLLPLEITQSAGAKLGRKIGGGHASFLTAARLGQPRPLKREDLMRAARAAGVDALILTDCPPTWGGVTCLAPGFPAAPDIARGTALSPGVLASLYAGEPGKKLRAKARKLAALGTLEARFSQRDQANSVLTALLNWKAEQFRAMGISDPFDSPQIGRFLRNGIDTGGPLRLFALFLDQRPIAGMVLAQAGGHASGMMTAYAPEEAIARCGPGDVLVMRLLEALAAEGVTGFDLGVGDARYKRLHAPEAIALVDVLVPASLKGAAVVLAYRLARAAKGRIKRNSGLFDAIKALRARF